MASTPLSRSLISLRHTPTSTTSTSFKRILSSLSITTPPPFSSSPLPTCPSTLLISSSSSLSLSSSVRFTSIRCSVNRSGPYSPLNNTNSSKSQNFSDRPPSGIRPYDYEHWLIVMDEPGGEGASKDQMIDAYVQILAKVLESEEEAKKKIYYVSCERYFGFCCEIDEETANKVEGLPEVLFVLPDDPSQMKDGK